MDIDYKSIGERIRYHRKREGMTQEVLAERSGIEPSNISHIERAATKVSLPTLIKIANTLNVTLDELVYGSLIKSSHVSVKAIDDILSECTSYEKAVLAEYLKKSLESFRKFKNGN